MSLAQMTLLRRILAAGEQTIDLPLAAMRANFEAFVGRFPGIDGFSVTPVAGFEQAEAEWVEVPIDGNDEPCRTRCRAILYLHGGGFVSGSVRSHRLLAARLARAAQRPVCLLGYRKAPEFPFPAPLEDGLALARHLDHLGCHELALAGDSAGAGLALQLAPLLQAAGLPPRGLALFSPWIDYRGSASVDRQGDPMVRRPGLEKMAAYYLGAATPEQVTPLASDLSQLPPTLIHVGGADALLDDSLALWNHLGRLGREIRLEIWPGMIHSWQLFAGRLEEGERSIERAGHFLARQL